MKRILWICNIMLPAIGQELHLPYSNREGWLSGIFEKVWKESALYSGHLLSSGCGAEAECSGNRLLFFSRRSEYAGGLCAGAGGSLSENI